MQRRKVFAADNKCGRHMFLKLPRALILHAGFYTACAAADKSFIKLLVMLFQMTERYFKSLKERNAIKAAAFTPPQRKAKTLCFTKRTAVFPRTIAKGTVKFLAADFQAVCYNKSGR